MVFLLDLLRSQFLVTPSYPTQEFTGQTVIVTGANCGLGLEAARHFVRLNVAKVILAVRNLEKGKAAMQSIEESEKRSNVVEVWELDLASYESVKQFARSANDLTRLDVVVENAGIMTSQFSMTEDNESSITTNVVSTIFLALLILPKLRETGVKFNVLPRLCIVASFVHYLTEFPERNADRIFDTLNDREKADMEDRYNISKLLGIFAVRELSELMTASPNRDRVVLNYLNPGWCITEVVREWTGVQLLVFKFARPIFARKTEVGARTLIAAAEGGLETHGQYLDDCQIGKVSPFVSSDGGARAQKKVWAELSQILEKIQPGILENI